MCNIWGVYDGLRQLGFQMRDCTDGVISITIFSQLYNRDGKGKPPEYPEFLRSALWAAKFFPQYDPVVLMGLADERVRKSGYRSWERVYEEVQKILNG